MSARPPFPGIRITSNGNQLVSYYTEARLADGGVFYPITPSTEMGELYQQSYAEGRLTVFGSPTVAIETEGEHSAQGGAIAYSVTGKRVVNFTSGQGLVYGVEQYYHAPGKLSTMVLQVAARALTKHALNVHCGHDDIYAVLDTGWIMLMAKGAQQAADQTLIIRKVTEQSLTPGINIQDGFLTSHIERTFLKPEAELIRQYLGAPDDIIDCPTEAQRELFGPTRRRVPRVIDLANPSLIGPVQNQEHYMNGVIARRNTFYEQIPAMLKAARKEFGDLTGRYYDEITEYNTEGAETVFVTLGSAAENIDAASDYVLERDGYKFGSIHLNMIRPFPEEAVVEALAGRKNVIILERTDEPLASDNPLTRDIRTCLSKALQREQMGATDGPRLSAEQMPRIFSGSYGLGSRDFRPEGILGAYEFVVKGRPRVDGQTAKDGVTYFTLGIDHSYAVTSDDAPSLLPDGAIAVRMHSIGGWGMITTGKNLGAIIGEFADDVSKRENEFDEHGRLKEVIHISANPKYGSEKKGAPTSYFLVVAPERVRVNCDLQHVDVVLCCDPKAFTHANPIAGLKPGGALVWESDESPEMAWKRIPTNRRQEILDKGIRLFTLPGFDIAKNATNRPDLQLRMQGNAFLGAFFGVSTFLGDYSISEERFHEVVLGQYEKKFGRFGEAVVKSNMEVMRQGFSRVTAVPHGPLQDADLSPMRGNPLFPIAGSAASAGIYGGGTLGDIPRPEKQEARANIRSMEYFDKEFRSGLGYHQPASALAAVGTMAAGTGATASKYVARRETPVFIAENCTQCMECISVCPDTALPNTAQEINDVLEIAIRHYVTDADGRKQLMAAIPDLEPRARAAMQEAASNKEGVAPQVGLILSNLLKEDKSLPEASCEELTTILSQLPLAYAKTKAIFGTAEKKDPGSGGIFSIFVSDLCKGCAACVTACGDHEALKMVPDSEQVNEHVATQESFMRLLPSTPSKFLGRFDEESPQENKIGVLRNHLMIQKNYDALVSGDGACAGCGEKSVLRALASTTETYMRPLFHAKAERLLALSDQLEADGTARLEALAEKDPEGYARLVKVVAWMTMGLGGENEEDTQSRIDARGAAISDQEVVNALSTVMRQDAFNHRELQPVEGRLANGMSVMAMAAHTGCNTVYGSTSPNNPHPYPWMNSLFQDGATVGWMFGESFISDHSRRSVIPERLGRVVMEADEGLSDVDLFELTHFNDTYMTPDEIHDLPKAWVIGGDGGMGDIGFQNVSKVVLQNRPNVNLLMLDTQVYSNTGGQNSDSSVMLGGGDMNQIGPATQGKLSEKKSVAECFTAGHGSPFVAQVSMANAAKLYKAMFDALDYRGTSFFQSFTSCQPEHGVADDASQLQAQRIRDSRGMPDFIFNPQVGETYDEAMDLKGNPDIDRDWAKKKRVDTGEKYHFTIVHWAATEARFRRHLKRIKPEQAEGMSNLEDVLVRVTQQDVVNRRYLLEDHRAFVPDRTVTVAIDGADGTTWHYAMSRQMVLFCVERRKSWRMLQSKAGIYNKDYAAQRSLLKKVDSGAIPMEDFLARSAELLEEEVALVTAN